MKGNQVKMYDIIGWIGMILFLANYALVANGMLAATGVLYNLVQVFGAVMIAVSLLPKKAWPVITLELFFVLIGVLALFK